jgi:muramoyltetrapeptide carboxypeptidase LdcA involved in peptidoglycan recycling
MPHALADAEWIAGHPEARADDIHAALRDDDVRAIVASIGGDDSIRVLPHLDLELVRAHPKALLGFSDTTCLHAAWRQAGVVSFYGSSVLCAFAENGGMLDYFVRGIEATLFDGHEAPGRWPENRDGWTVERLEWERPETHAQVRALRPATGWRWLQGTGRAWGPLFAGCIEVLDWLRGTRWWPDLDGAVLALETSEEQPSPESVGRMLRSLAATGDLARIGGLLFGRPGGHLLEPSAHGEYDEAVLQVVRDECGLDRLPIVTGMDFGHTDPPWTLPIGVACEVDADVRTIAFVEPCVS